MAREHNYAHRAFSVILRLCELACAVIVLAILARFCYLITIARVSVNSRIVYAMVLAGITIVYTIIFGLPFHVLFMSFPMDLILFIMWIVSFALLANLAPRCDNDWFYNNWSYYWGRFYDVGPIGTVRTRGAGCGYWRASLAFNFLAAFAHLLSFILGIYVYRTYINVKETVSSAKQQMEKIKKPHPQASGANGAQIKRTATPPSPTSDRHSANLSGAAPVVPEQQV
jgi:energy-coupling factor transporter transmembrane protein EcfT